MTDVGAVIDGVQVLGELNTPLETITAHVRYAIRQGHSQLRPEVLKSDLVALVGSGPSLLGALPELRDAIFRGAKLVALNGAFRWCVEQNLQPKAVVVVDAQETAARFLEPDVPQCLYYVASQCHPASWAMVAGRERVIIWHAVMPEDPLISELDQYYGKDRWTPIGGGTTVATRALALLRTSGYARFELFGIDSCWMDAWELHRHGLPLRHPETLAVKRFASRTEAEAVACYAANDYSIDGYEPVCVPAHHAFLQAENERDRRIRLDVGPTHGTGQNRTFECAPWHVQQAEDFLRLIRHHGDDFQLRVHGDGLLAHMLKIGADAMLAQRESALTSRSAAEPMGGLNVESAPVREHVLKE